MRLSLTLPLCAVAVIAIALSGAMSAPQSPEPLDVARGKRIDFARDVQPLLRETQLDDGSWYVRSRAIPLLPYFDSAFPHGKGNSFPRPRPIGPRWR